MKRICFFANPDWSHVRRWAEYFVNHSNEVFILSETDPTVSFEPPRIHIRKIDMHTMRLPLPWIVKFALAVRRILSEIRPDIVHIHGLEMSGFAFAMLRPKTTILTLYGMDVTRWGKRKEISRMKYWYKKMTMKRVGAITTASKFLARAGAEYAQIPANKIKVIPFGVDTKFFSNREPKKEKKIFTLGILKDLRREYGLENFFDSVEIIHSEIPNLRVLVGGEGPWKNNLKDYSKRKGLEGIVGFLGPLLRFEVRDFYAKLDVFVMPSCFESFGVVGLEAQSMEVPVVAVNAGGVNEVVLDGGTGISVPPNDSGALARAILRLYSNVQERSQMGIAGRRHVQKNFEWQSCAKAMLKLYEEVLVRNRKNVGTRSK